MRHYGHWLHVYNWVVLQGYKPVFVRCHKLCAETETRKIFFQFMFLNDLLILAPDLCPDPYGGYLRTALETRTCEFLPISLSLRQRISWLASGATKSVRVFRSNWSTLAPQCIFKAKAFSFLRQSCEPKDWKNQRIKILFPQQSTDTAYKKKVTIFQRTLVVHRLFYKWLWMRLT